MRRSLARQGEEHTRVGSAELGGGVSPREQHARGPGDRQECRRLGRPSSRYPLVRLGGKRQVLTPRSALPRAAAGTVPLLCTSPPRST